MAWTEVAVDGLPASDLSGNSTLYEVYDGTTVALTGRFNDQWMPPDRVVTHWALWFGSDDPIAAPELWHDVSVDGDPDEAPVALYEIYDGSSTGLTARVLRQWILPEGLTVTHWKAPTLSDPPA